jgi:pyruvate kinase
VAAQVSLTIEELIAALDELQAEMRTRYVAATDTLAKVQPRHRLSAGNLLDYLTLRRYDLRDVQDALAELGLSSLGRAEGHVITTVERVLYVLHLLHGDTSERTTEAAVSYGRGRQILEANARGLLGDGRPGRAARILVTMPTEAADDVELISRLLERGMDLARINTAHDDAAHWARMADNIELAARRAGRSCPILVDLPGPKIRTGPIEPGPRVLRLRPQRDPLGRATAPATALLVPDDAPAPAGAAADVLPVPAEWLARRSEGERIYFRDARSSKRSLLVGRVTAAGTEVATWDTAYVMTGTRLTAPPSDRATVGQLPAKEQALVLHVGDLLTLTDDDEPVSVPAPTADGAPTALRIGCTLPAVLAGLDVGHRVWFDDGKIGGRVEAVRQGEVDVRIAVARAGGAKLRAGKGINVPDTLLRISPSLVDEAEALAFASVRADLIALSFVQDPAEVSRLQQHLEAMGRSDAGIVLKIETVAGFAALPDLLLGAMASERLGVMVARGDLAVECGFERLAEVQEEVLWLSEAGHVPVIWATQVLDQQARTGQPSRAEISDAALAGRAECVMLNKGPHVVEAVGTLDEILRRMGSHQHKKASLLRRLRTWSTSDGSTSSDRAAASGEIRLR